MNTKPTHKNLEGTVAWFDDLSGEGMIGCTDGNTYYVHWSSIRGKFEPKNGKKSWTSLESGWKVKFDLYASLATKQCDNVKIIRKDKPRERPSMYLNKAEMKAKLAAANAMMDEIFPQDEMDWDEYMKLSRTTKKLTKKQEARLQALEAMRTEHNKRLKLWNDHKTSLICSIYRQHSAFSLLRIQDERNHNDQTS